MWWAVNIRSVVNSIGYVSAQNNQNRITANEFITTMNKKLSYLQRKCASNVAILYGADDISI